MDSYPLRHQGGLDGSNFLLSLDELRCNSLSQEREETGKLDLKCNTAVGNSTQLISGAPSHLVCHVDLFNNNNVLAFQRIGRYYVPPWLIILVYRTK